MNIPSELKEQITQGNCFVCIGAGLSQGAGLPSWPDMLFQMIDWCAKNSVDIADRVDIETGIKAGKLLTLAQTLTERMGKEKFRKFMNELFRNSNLKPTDTYSYLPRIPFFAVMTFNYDVLLETLYTLTRGTSPRTFTHDDTPEMSEALRSKEFFLLKAHGTIEPVCS